MLTMTHASYDWAMSRDTNFYSTAFGFIITTGQTLSALAFAILLLAALNKKFTPPLTTFLNKRPEQNPPEAGAPNLLNDIGNILLTLVILWTYVSFMQLLIIWMGNKSDDNGYYLKRGLGQPSPWRYIGLTLITLHFFIPFFLLLFRRTKNTSPPLPPSPPSSSPPTSSNNTGSSPPTPTSKARTSISPGSMPPPL